MNKFEAIKLAIEALEFQAEETYEGSEYDEPDVQEWVAKRNDAISVLRALTDVLQAREQ